MAFLAGPASNAEKGKHFINSDITTTLIQPSTAKIGPS
jgi:hypothetical protein